MTIRKEPRRILLNLLDPETRPRILPIRSIQPSRKGTSQSPNTDSLIDISYWVGESAAWWMCVAVLAGDR